MSSPFTPSGAQRVQACIASTPDLKRLCQHEQMDTGKNPYCLLCGVSAHTIERAALTGHTPPKEKP